MEIIKKRCNKCRKKTDHEARLYVCCRRFICTVCGEHTSEKRTD